jgi:hypothetical protein
MEPDDLLCSRNARPPNDGEGKARCPSCRRTRTVKKTGKAPTLVLCSRNARPEKGLVRRPHFDQHGCPSRREKQASLEGLFRSRVSSDARSKGQFGYSPKRDTSPDLYISPLSVKL